MTEVDQIEDVAKQFNDMLTSLFGESTKKEDPLRQEGKDEDEEGNLQDETKEVGEDTTLYDLLNAVPESRKTMNTLFRKPNEINILGNHVSANPNINRSLLEKCVAISNVWEQDDKLNNSTISSSAATLQLEAPVSFAWSNNSGSNSNNNNNKDFSSVIKAQTSSNISSVLTQKHTGEPMRQVLFKKVNESLIDLTKHTKSWNYIIYGIDDEIEEDDSEFGDSTTGNNSDMNMNNGSQSTFKVNPLAKFVATELPREKKDPSAKKSSHKHKSKKGTFRWMWAGKSSRHKSKKDKNKDEIDIIKMNHSNISADLDDFTVPSVEDGRGSSNISLNNINRQQTNDLDFDLETRSSVGTNPFDGSAFSSQSNSLANSNSEVDTNTNNSQNNINTVNEIDLLSDVFNDIPLPVIPSTMNSSVSGLTQNTAGDDDDFGDFEASGSEANNTSNQNVSIPASVSSSRENSVPNILPPGLMSFVPLQPQKKP